MLVNKYNNKGKCKKKNTNNNNGNNNNNNNVRIDVVTKLFGISIMYRVN